MGYAVALFLFWLSFFLLLYTYILFPVLVVIRGVLFLRPIRTALYTPKVDLIIAAYNEVAVVKQKLDNIFSLNYPADCVEVVFASDGSDDGTDEIVKTYAGNRVKFLSLPRQGKNQTINEAVAASSGDILVFTDADTMFEPDALTYLVSSFNDPEVGGVAGNYLHTKNTKRGGGERDFWNFERIMKLLQSRAGSVTSAWGPIYAIRRMFFKPIPIGVTDDFYISTLPLLHHRRLVFESHAVATGPVASSSDVEFNRKVRIITAGLRGVWENRKLLNPFRYGFLAVQVFSHKVLRRLMSAPILMLFVTSLILWKEDLFYALVAGLQLLFHGAALVGFLLRHTAVGEMRLLRLPFFFDMVYTASVVALYNLLLGRRYDIWVPQHEREN